MRDLEYNTLSKPLEQAGGFGSLLYKRREELNQAVRRAGGGGSAQQVRAQPVMMSGTGSASAEN